MNFGYVTVNGVNSNAIFAGSQKTFLERFQYRYL